MIRPLLLSLLQLLLSLAMSSLLLLSPNHGVVVAVDIVVVLGSSVQH